MNGNPGGYAIVFAILAGIGMFVWLISRAGDRARRSEMRLVNRCTTCGYDLRATHERCPECGKPVNERDPREAAYVALDPKLLHDDWPANAITSRIPVVGETPVSVHSTRNGIEADLLCQHIESWGIRCRVDRREGYPGPIGYTQAVTDLQVVVYSGDEEAARAIVEHFRVGKSGV